MRFKSTSAKLTPIAAALTCLFVGAPGYAASNAPFQIPTNGGSVTSYHIGSSDSGDFVVEWSEYKSGNASSTSSDYMQIFNSDASPKSAVITLPDSISDVYSSGHNVAVAGDGTIAVSYVADVNGKDQVLVQRYTADGTPNGQPIDVAAFDIFHNQVRPHYLQEQYVDGTPKVAIDGDGDIVVAYSTVNNNDWKSLLLTVL